MYTSGNWKSLHRRTSVIMWHGYDAQVDQVQTLRPNLAALDLLLERRLCNSLEASSGGLWTLPPPGLPDHILLNHVDDEGLRSLRAFFGAKIFAQAVPPAIEQTFASYPGTVRAVIEAQIAKPAVLSRATAPYQSDYVAEWLKMLVGNMVPVIMDTVSDWEDASTEDVERVLGVQTGTEMGNPHLTIIEDDDHVESRSNFELYEDDPDRLAELLANHFTGLDALDEEI
ncbi:hypothetical protein OPQ81_011429 [Rhizoctonia solani]|nr:hypothetical protein OPQ81_011429 [Rhizoctonia solani]